MNNLEPKSVWRYFEEILQVPRLSKKEEKIIAYVEKFAEILKANKINSLTVIHMEVPCCSGLTQIVRKAIAKNKIAMSFEDVTIDLHGNISRTETVQS